MKQKIECGSIVFDTCFCPTDNSLLGVGTIEGSLQLHNITQKEMVFDIESVHEGSCRSIDFSTDGRGIMAVSKLISRYYFYLFILGIF
jgi:hypothetical protein